MTLIRRLTTLRTKLPASKSHLSNTNNNTKPRASFFSWGMQLHSSSDGFFFKKTIILICTLLCCSAIYVVIRSENHRTEGGYEIAQRFPAISRTFPIHDTYITLWLHQVHRWFAVPESPSSSLPSTHDQIKSFLQEAQQAGFTSVMGDIPWEWTEREAANDIRLDTFGKDWMQIACDLGLSLHVVITMREAPPWLSNVEINPDTADIAFDVGSSLQFPKVISGTPSTADDTIWKLQQAFVRKTTRLLLETYGSSCIKTISPTMNNEYETRYAQTQNSMRDYSEAAIQQFQKWQTEKQKSNSSWNANFVQDPPRISSGPICEPIMDTDMWTWLGFREEFLADRYIGLCKAVHEGASTHSTSSTTGATDSASWTDLPLVNCLLHFGEMFATTDIFHSNIFFRLASSKYVNDVVMDSNMALSGSPSSPSIVAILVSTAQAYNKTIHYEAATERILECDDTGKVKKLPSNMGEKSFWSKGGPLLLQRGIQYSLEAGVESIGVTNLCLPSMAGNLFQSLRQEKAPLPNSEKTADTASAALYTARPFQATAVIYVPYRAFYAWSLVVSDISCKHPKSPCWHKSFAEIPAFGRAQFRSDKTSCAIDLGQDGLIKVWDDLRLRHSHIAVIGDVAELREPLLSQASERVVVIFPCVTEGAEWSFYQGAETQEAFERISRKYPFARRRVTGLEPRNGCPTTTTVE